MEQRSNKADDARLRAEKGNGYKERTIACVPPRTSPDSPSPGQADGCYSARADTAGTGVNHRFRRLQASVGGEKTTLAVNIVSGYSVG
ncbi:MULTISPECIES: hypothetical protein [Dickeya]|uniref:hypothetical protein n=1 Tax=Dickeya TaxID=204037 RepID=UPI001CE5019E|nr:hypothetical protein FGI04_17690 [Dickeya zeae]